MSCTYRSAEHRVADDLNLPPPGKHYWTDLDSVKAFTGHEYIMAMPSATPMREDFRYAVKLQRIARQGKSLGSG